MATDFCQKCKKTHPGRACDFDEKGDCAETADVTEIAKAVSKGLNENNDTVKGK